MKKSIYLFALSLLCFACSKNITEESSIDTTTLKGDEIVTITFSPYSITSMTRGTETPQTIDAFNRLDVWIINGTDTIDIHQQKEDQNYGSLSVSLNKTKTYSLIAVAHKNTDTTTLREDTISFPENKIKETLFYKTSFSPATSTNLSCVMDRIVGMFRLETTDSIRSEVKKIKFTVYNTGCKFNINGTTGNFIDKENTIEVKVRNSDGSATFNTYIMANDMKSTSYFDIKVEALTNDDRVIEERLFEEVPIKDNYKTTYQGTLLVTTPMNVSFTTYDWDSFETVNF